jgi:hypothetical protein
MSDQTLRDALEAEVAKWGNSHIPHVVNMEWLRETLAAHPAEGPYTEETE